MESGLLIGGRYRLRERLGRGGMSVVWRADDDVLGREVAVKVLDARLADDPDLLRQIRAEARAAAGLRHGNVVGVFDYGETTDPGSPCGAATGGTAKAPGQPGRTLPYVVMELVDGRSLADLLTAGALPWRLAVLICAQVAAALAAAHARGIVHRDVKPGNVMVTAAGAKLVDFGISAAAGEVDDDGDGRVLGTPAYLAPERVEGGPVRPATDVYALGLLLYLMLAGRMPWQASTSTQMIKAHRYAEPGPLPDVPGLPAEVVGMVERCLAKRPDERPGAATVADVLGEIAGLPPAALLRAVATPTDALPQVSAATRPTVAAAAGVTAPARATRHRARGTRTTTAAAWRPKRRDAVVLGSVAAALAAAGLTGWAVNETGGGPVPATAAAEPSAAPTRSVVTACAVRYALRPAASGRASAAVTISNTGAAPVRLWQLRFALPGDQRLIRGWSATWQQVGSTVHADGGTLPAGGSVAAGFETAYRASASLPVSFELNGEPCRAEVAVLQPSATTPGAVTAAVAGSSGSGPGQSGKGDGGKGEGKAGDRGGGRGRN